jgi:UDP-N-acetylmuramoyl-tripeptide--D-alanyl-D-alanine ligase
LATPIPTNRATFDSNAMASATRGVLHGPAVTVRGVTTDSRAVTAGSAFVALRGEHHDGHAYLDVAVKAGATLLVVERGRAARTAQGANGATILEVPDTLVAWGDLARAHLAAWRRPGAAVVAITGSAGKTTTKELEAALLGAVAPTHFTAGNLNNRIGVPAVVFALEPQHRFCVLEMGMSLPGELDAITSFARPDVSIVTNVGVAHSEGVGGREGVMREKGAVYRALESGGVAVVNLDDELAVRAAASTWGRVVTFGTHASADYRLLRREPRGADGSLVVLGCPDRELQVLLPLPGEAAAIDLAAALAAAEAAGGLGTATRLTRERIEQALQGVVLSGRASVRRLGGDVLVLDDTYNANPASMRAALATLGELAGTRRRVCVLGEMKELGALAEAEHTSLGDVLGAAKLDLVIGCGGMVELALDRAEAAGVQVVRARSTEEAARFASENMRSGDAFLVKGSRSVGAERVVEALAKASESLPSPPKSASSEGA